MTDSVIDRRETNRRAEDVDLREMRREVHSVSDRLDGLTRRFDTFDTDAKTQRSKIRLNQHGLRNDFQKLIVALAPIERYFERRAARRAWFRRSGRAIALWAIAIMGTGLAGWITASFEKLPAFFIKGPPP